MSEWTKKIPSFVWILFFVAAVALFVGALIGGFYAFTHWQGFGSIILLVAAWGCLRVGANTPEFGDSSIGIALVILFFATMGAALDQPGNFIYNQPMEWIFCPAETDLVHAVTSRAARGGGVSVNQNFTCATESGQVLRAVGGWEFFLYRFFQYVLLGYFLLGLSRLYTRIKGKVKPPVKRPKKKTQV